MTKNLTASLTPIAYVEGRYIWSLFSIPVSVTKKARRNLRVDA